MNYIISEVFFTTWNVNISFIIVVSESIFTFYYINSDSSLYLFSWSITTHKTYLIIEYYLYFRLFHYTRETYLRVSGSRREVKVHLCTGTQWPRTWQYLPEVWIQITHLTTNPSLHIFFIYNPSLIIQSPISFLCCGTFQMRRTQLYTKTSLPQRSTLSISLMV